MTEIWYELNIKKPAIVVLPVKKATFVKDINNAMQTYLLQVKNANKLFLDAATLLSSLYARRKNSFRHMSGYRSVGKLNVALRRLALIDLTNEVQNFCGALTDMRHAAHAELPSRQNLEYILVRCITYRYIHERIQVCCLQIADFFVPLLRENRFIDYCTLLLSNVAKIKALGAYLGNKAVQLYAELLKQRSNFPATQHIFLSADIKLPESLNAFDEVNTTADELAPKCSGTVKLRTTKIDLGEIVEREKPTEINTQKLSRKSVIFDVTQLNNVPAVKSFIQTETEARKKSPTQCITKNMFNHEWLGAVKIFERKLLANDHKKALNIFCKFISSKIK